MENNIEKFKEYQKISEQAENFKNELWDDVKNIFQYLLSKQNAINETRENIINSRINLFDYYRNSRFDDFMIDDAGLRLHIYSYFDDDSSGSWVAPIPLEYIKNTEMLDKWFDIKVKEIDDVYNKTQQIMESKRREKEFEEYKRLKNIYGKYEK